MAQVYYNQMQKKEGRHRDVTRPQRDSYYYPFIVCPICLLGLLTVLSVHKVNE